MHKLSSVLLIKAVIFYFHGFDLGGHLGHPKHEIPVIRKLHLNLQVDIKNAFNNICSTNQGRHILFS
jgi:hypothetical protein